MSDEEDAREFVFSGAKASAWSPISSPESAFLLVSTKNTDIGHFQFMRSSSPALEVASVRVLGADQKKSGLWGRDCLKSKATWRLSRIRSDYSRLSSPLKETKCFYDTMIYKGYIFRTADFHNSNIPV